MDKEKKRTEPEEKAYREGVIDQINSDRDLIADEVFTVDEELMTPTVQELIKYAKRTNTEFLNQRTKSDGYLIDCKRMASDLQKMHIDSERLFDEIMAFKLVMTRMALPD